MYDRRGDALYCPRSCIAMTMIGKFTTHTNEEIPR